VADIFSSLRHQAIDMVCFRLFTLCLVVEVWGACVQNSDSLSLIQVEIDSNGHQYDIYDRREQKHDRVNLLQPRLGQPHQAVPEMKDNSVTVTDSSQKNGTKNERVENKTEGDRDQLDVHGGDDHVTFRTIVVFTSALVFGSEAFDRSFFIALIFAMQHKTHGKAIWFGGFSALAIHACFAVLCGELVAKVVPHRFLTVVGVFLFAIFSALSLHTYLNADEDETEDIRVCEMKLSEVPEGERERSQSYLVATKAFSLIMLSQCGDRSQLAILEVASTHSAAPVLVGALIGLASVEVLAVLAGVLFAERCGVTVRRVSLISAILFAIFAVLGGCQLILASRDPLTKHSL